MSDFTVEIIESSGSIIEIDTSVESNQNNISVEATSPTTVEVINTEKLLASDFPDFYHTKIIDFDSAVSGLLPASFNLESIQDIIGQSGVIGGTGISVSYNDTTGYTTIHSSGLILGSSTMYLGNSYITINGLTTISGISIASPTTLINCIIDGGTP